MSRCVLHRAGEKVQFVGAFADKPGMRRPALVAVLVLGVLCAGAASGSAGSSPTLIAIDSREFRLGPLVWNWQARNRAVTLRDFIGAFGPESTCVRVPGGSPAEGHVTWESRGIRGDFTTLGNLPHPNDDACTAPAYVQPDTVEAFGRAWRTSRGLQVGGTIARLHALYPQATLHKDGWWLVTRANDPLWGTFGELVAGVHNGRVSYLRLVLHAEGD